MKEQPPWLDRLNVVCLGLGAGLSALIAVVAASTLLWLTIFAGIASATCLVAATPHVQAIYRRRRRISALPRATYEWRIVSPARRLADEARDHATKAAALGLPTGEWTDLAAFWTAWADTEEQDSTAEAAETPVERPKPPKGDGGVGNADKAATLEAVTPIRTVPQTEAPVVLVEAFFPPSDAIKVTIDGVGQRVAIAPTGRGSARRDLVVVNDTPHGFQTGVRQGETKQQRGEQPVAELRIPANTRAITTSMIYPACPEGGMAHTVEMKGAPATRHEVPCDCDELPHEPRTVDVCKPQLRDGEHAASSVIDSDGRQHLMTVEPSTGVYRHYVNGQLQSMSETVTPL